jgi:hypothetical protein
MFKFTVILLKTLRGVCVCVCVCVCVYLLVWNFISGLKNLYENTKGQDIQYSPKECPTHFSYISIDINIISIKTRWC